MKIVATKVSKNGSVIHIYTTDSGKKEFFAKRKKFWIAYENSSARCALNCSNSLKYLEKIFADM